MPASAFSPDLATITEMCRHHSGIGAEQLLVLTGSPTADAALDIYNVDGFKAEACGNATRCVAWYLMDQTNQKTTSISCNGRAITGKMIDDLTVQVDLGEVLYLPQHEEVSAKQWRSFEHGFAIDVGNPHLVFLADQCNQQELATVAPLIQADPLFQTASTSPWPIATPKAVFVPGPMSDRLGLQQPAEQAPSQVHSRLASIYQ